MKLIFLYSVMIMWVAFNAIPYDGELLKMFPLAQEQLIPFKTWIYFLFQYIGVAMLCLVIAMDSFKYRFACYIFLFIHIGKIVDYFLTYNTAWFKVLGIGITYNVVSFIIFSAAIVYEYGNNRN